MYSDHVGSNGASCLVVRDAKRSAYLPISIDHCLEAGFVVLLRATRIEGAGWVNGSPDSFLHSRGNGLRRLTSAFFHTSTVVVGVAPAAGVDGAHPVRERIGPDRAARNLFVHRMLFRGHVAAEERITLALACLLAGKGGLAASIEVDWVVG
jgi:hypothetical protein